MEPVQHRCARPVAITIRGRMALADGKRRTLRHAGILKRFDLNGLQSHESTNCKMIAESLPIDVGINGQPMAERQSSRE